MYVSSGGEIKNIVNNGGYLYITGGEAYNTDINRGKMTLIEGKISNTDVRAYTTVNGGTATSTVVQGILDINGGEVNYTTIKSGGCVYITAGNVSSLTLSKGGYLGGFAFPEYKSFREIKNGIAEVGNWVTVSGSEMCVSRWGIERDVTISGGTMRISGGTALDTTLRDGCIYIYSGGTATRTLLDGSYNNYMEVRSGGVANSITIKDGASLYVASGGSATWVDWTPGIGYVYAEGDVTFKNVISSVYLVSAGQLISHKDVIEGEDLTDTGKILSVMSGGTANDIIVEGACLYVSGGTINRIKTRDYNNVVYAGIANNTIIEGGHFHVYSGTLNNTVVQCGTLFLNGGTANNTSVVHSYGYIFVGDAIANNTMLNSGCMEVLENGVVNQTSVSSGGGIWICGKANYTSAFDGATVNVYGGGSMFGMNLYSGADLNISSGGNVNTLFYNGPATATIHSGGQLTSTTVNSSGTLNVHDGAKVISATLKNGGTMNYHGGTAYNVELLYGGVMNIQSGAVRKGQIADKGQMFVSNGGTASGAIIKNGGIQHVLSGGSADGTQIWLNGIVQISSGAVVTDMLTKHGAKVHVFGGTISNTTMERGITSVYQGGKAVETEVGYGAYLMLGFTSDGCSGVANSYDTTVLSGGGLTVMSGAVAEDTVNYGTLTCNNGGTLLGETVIHGRANLAGNAVVTDETSITFDVSEREVSAMQESYREAMLNSYYVAREADMTISVSADQTSGSYILANWALEAKKGTFTLEVDGTEVGTFSTTKSLTYNGKTYSLYCFDDSTNSKALTLKVSNATARDAWTDLGSGDFDGDGIEESLVSDGTNLYAAREDLWLGNLSGSEEIASIVDYNDDGTDDLLIHNTATDQMTAWLIKDGATYSTLAIA